MFQLTSQEDDSLRSQIVTLEKGRGKHRKYLPLAFTEQGVANLDIFWLKDESLEDSANLPDPAIIAAEIAEDLRAALEQFETIAEDLKK